MPQSREDEPPKGFGRRLPARSPEPRDRAQKTATTSVWSRSRYPKNLALRWLGDHGKKPGSGDWAAARVSARGIILSHGRTKGLIVPFDRDGTKSTHGSRTGRLLFGANPSYVRLCILHMPDSRTNDALRPIPGCLPSLAPTIIVLDATDDTVGGVL